MSGAHRPAVSRASTILPRGRAGFRHRRPRRAIHHGTERGGMMSLVLVDPRAIQPDPDNVRRDATDDLDSLTESIREHGLLQPLGVARENGGFRVVYGNRRRAAAIKAGLPEVPCVVVEASGEDRLIQQMLENLQRRDLNDMDKAEGFARLRRNLARQYPEWSDRQLDDEIGRIVGLTAATIRRYLGLRDLAPGVRDLLAEGSLTVTQAQHLAAVADPVNQTELAELAVEKGLSAAALSRACRASANRPGLSPAEAIELGEKDQVPEPGPAARGNGDVPARMARAPRPKDEDADDADLWIGSADAKPDEDDGPRAPAGPRTADGHRVFKIKTVSAFSDEVDRLARCLQEGDLARAADEEPDAPIQLRLVSRQLTYVQQELASFLKRRGWSG
ncbi:MAG: ParB/RepB/Spo0J family partition protein [Chloroflexi bacterium]|nr:ParB/RepB/Spo0J family partition protein [Chloroflexota bacterium]